MLNAHGYAVLTDPRKDRATEIDTVMCCHCNKHTHIKPGQRASDIGGYCSSCDDYVCETCFGKRECTPFLKWVEEMEAKNRFRRDLG